MVSRLFKLLNRQSNGINEAALLLGLFTFTSQLLGLLRDRLLATFLGAGPTLDVYYAAFNIPDFLYVSVATLAAITVLLPYLSERYGSGDAESHDRAKSFLNQVFTVLFFFLALVSVILFILMPILARWMAPGFQVGQLSQLVLMSRVMLVQPIIVGISNMVSSVTQMFRKFFVAALSPVIYNLGIIFGIVVLRPIFGVMGLAYGVVLGAILHLIIQIPVLAHHNFIPKFTFKISWKEIRSVVLVSVPRTIGLSISSLSGVILTAMASLLGTGSIAIFNLTNNILNVPVGLVGIAYSIASFPVLVKLFQNQQRSKFSEHIVSAAQKIVFWSVPMMILLIVLRAQVVRVILGTHSFSWNDTRIAAACVALFVIGLVGQSLVYLLVRGYYAIGNTKTPLLWNFVGEAVTVALALLFVWMFRTMPWFGSAFSTVLRLNGVTSLEILALPLAFSIGNLFNFFTLWYVFLRDFPETNTFQLIRTTVQTVAASLCMGAVTYGVLNIMVLLVNQGTFWGVFLQGFVSAVIGISIFVAILVIIKNEDMKEFIVTIHQKFWKSQVLVEAGEVETEL